MFRKRRQPTPHFRLPPPYQPITGVQAPLMVQGIFPYCAMVQVAAEDTHENYVLCRGHDTRINKFIDYEAGNADKPGIPVAKPYGNRIVGMYQIAQVFPAVLPLQGTHPQRADWYGSHAPTPTSVPWRVGQNPGVAETSKGHPEDLQETIEILYTDEGVVINWMLLDSATGLVELCLAEDHPGQAVKFNCYFGVWDSSTDDWDYDECSITVAAIDHRYDVPYPVAGATGLFTPRRSDTYGTIFECVSLDCSSEKACCT